MEINMKKLGFGLMRLPLTDTADNTAIDIERTKNMVDRFMADGFTYFDTAAPYHGGESEVSFRKAVSERYPRDAYTVTDKLSLFKIEKAEDIPSFFDTQLEKLGVDYVDCYLLHAMSESSYARAKEFGAFEFVAEKKEEGKIKKVGFSFHDSPEVLDKILTEQPQMEVVQLQINYLDWHDGGVRARECYEVARRHEKDIIIMEPIKGGALANVSPEAVNLFNSARPGLSNAGWAVSFCASLEGVIMVLSGMSDEAQMEDNLSYMNDFSPLSDEEIELCKKAGEIVKNDNAIGCTACRYCVEGCPQKIAIPDIFKGYNNFRRFQSANLEGAKGGYNYVTKDGGKASDCIGCGLCEESCPQHLEIRKLLSEIAQLFEN